jgi:nascent polypeptide-associated complex subunit beta
MFVNALSLFTLLPLTTAHFLLSWPDRRGFDDAQAGSFPCGGFDSVSSNRTEFPLSGGPIQLDMHHSQTRIAVYLAIGDNPGSNYSIVLRPQFQRDGPGNFCLGQVNIPSNLNITAGTNATIQVVTNGDPDGGLYQVSHNYS